MKFKMSFRENNFSTQSIFLIFVSFFGLFFFVIMFLWAPPAKTYYIQRTVILSIFILICILGIFAAIYPSICKKLMKFQEKSKQKTNGGNIRFKGHHPDCGKFSSHTLTINGKKYCPGCLGLSVGALIAIMGALIYYFVGCPLIYGEISFWTGVFMLFSALFLIVFLNTGKKLKLISNMALVTGSFLILLGLDSVKGNLIIELYFLLLVVFWILTRIMVSETNHEIICRDCLKEFDCIYE